MEIYVVQPGDSVDAIADKTGTDVTAIINTNQLIYPYRLAVGQALFIPGGAMEPRRAVWSNGYAYPFISPWVLDQTLPYLSELSVFSYGFTEEGELIPPRLDEQWMIRAAGEMGAEATLTLTPMGTDERFNNRLVSAVVRNPAAQRSLLRNLILVMTEKGYSGVNFDFEYILAEDRDGYTAFVRLTGEVFRPLGFTVSVALAPKYSDDQPGILYEGMDYEGLGQAADRVLLMTYEWGYTYGEPMAIAPINEVRRVVEYAVTKIPSEKICLGVPNYGYDWPLPFESGVTRARTLGNIEAVQMAVFYGVPIQFDETAQAPFFRYMQYGIEHEVWFEDVRSYDAKFRLVEEFGLQGIGVWQIMQLFRAGWELLASRFHIMKE